MTLSRLLKSITLNCKVLEYDWYGHAEDYEEPIPQHENYQYDKALVGDYTFDFSEHFHKVKDCLLLIFSWVDIISPYGITFNKIICFQKDFHLIRSSS